MSLRGISACGIGKLCGRGLGREMEGDVAIDVDGEREEQLRKQGYCCRGNLAIACASG